MAGVVWDVAIRSLWRRGFEPWAAAVRGDVARAATLRLSTRRRCLAAAWRAWRSMADELYGERTLGGAARLCLSAVRSRGMLRRWRVFSRWRAKLRRIRGHPIPRRR
jgi:hypothetical protein